MIQAFGDLYRQTRLCTKAPDALLNKPNDRFRVGVSSILHM